MNIPPETARAQGHHGIKGAAHGVKGGRPRLDLTEEERRERRRKQREAWRRGNGIQPRKVLTREERKERSERKHRERWDQEYRGVWGRPPGQPLTPEEFAKGQGRLRAWVRGLRDRNHPLAFPVHFVRSHYRELRRKERAELIGTEEAASRRRLPKEERLEERLEHIRRYEARQRWIESRTPRRAAPAVGRNEPCPCGSGRKFKKCCGP